MKILLTTMSYPSPDGYRGGGFIHSQAVALKKRGHLVAVLYLDLRSIRRKRKLGYSTYDLDGVKIYRYAFPCGPVKQVLYRIAEVLALYTYQKLCQDFGKPDFLHGHFWQGGLLARTIGKKAEIPYVVTEHGSNVLMNRLNRLEYKLACQTYTDSVACIAVSRALQRKMEVMAVRPVTVVPNILPDYMQCELDRLQKRPSEEFTFFSCGNLVPGKRFDLLLKAYAALPPGVREKSRLQIAGEGPERQALEALAKRLRIEQKVDFLGRIDNRKLPERYGRSDCFVLASDFETFGVVYIEAMACGLPVIATRCGGPEDFVNESNGVLIEVGNEYALSIAMKQMVCGLTSYNRKKIQEQIRNSFGEAAVCKLLCAIYGEVVEVYNEKEKHC